MKKALNIFLTILLLFPLSASAQVFGDGNIGTLDQWSSISGQITQRTANKPIKISGLSDGCMYLLSGLVTTNVANPTCTGGSGGGSGSGTFGTSTNSAYGGVLNNYALNTTDIVEIGGFSTTTAKFWFDPNSSIAQFIAKLLVGTSANTTDFPGAQSVFSQSDTGVTTSQKVGVLGEAVASVTSGRGVYGIGKASGTLQGFGVYGLGTTTASTDTATIYGVNGQALATHAGISVGVSGTANSGNDNRAFDGVGTTNGTGIGYGIVSTGKVASSADTAIAYGGYFQSIDTHAGGSNVALLGSALGGASNYSFYGINGTLFNAGNIGGATTTPGTALGIVGDGVISGHLTAQDYTSTSTRANVFPYASTTQLTVRDYQIIGNAIPSQLSSFGTQPIDLQINKSVNDGIGMQVQNVSQGSSAVSYYALGNYNTTLGVPGASAHYTGNLVYGGSNWDGSQYGFNSLKVNDLALYNTDGNTILGAATSSPSHNVGNIDFYGGFTGSFNSGIPDMRLSDIGFLGIGTTTPAFPLSVVGSGGVVADIFNGTSTKNASRFVYASTTAISSSNLTSGNCVQAGTGGLLTTIGSACGSGGSVTGTTGQAAYLSGTNTAIGTSSMFFAANQQIGVGTTSPWGMFSIHHPAIGLNVPLFVIASSTQTGTTTLLVLDNAGNFTVGSTTATTTNTGGFVVGNGAINSIGTSAITSISSLVAGNLIFDTNAGIVQALDLPIDSTATVGTVESYCFNNMGSTTLCLYGLADGSGFTKAGTLGVSVGTSTPFAKLTVWGEGTGTGRTFAVVNSASTTNFQIQDNGVIGVGTTSPFATFAINPIAGKASNQFVVGSSTATNFLIDNSGHIFVPNITSVTGGTNRPMCFNATTGEMVDDTTTVCQVSSERFKHDIVPLTVSGLDIVNALKTVSYVPNDDAPYDFHNTQFGFTAEQVASVDPHLAEYGQDGNPRTLDDRAILSVLAKSIQELSKRGSNAVRSAEENWQWFALAILGLAIVGQQIQINKLKK